MVALLDTGSTQLFIHQSCLPSAAIPTLSKKPLISNTAAGKLESRTEVGMTGIVCPEFTRSKRMYNLTAYVIESPCRYNVILGQDFLEATGMVLDFSKKKVIWDKLSVVMKPMIMIDNGREAFVTFNALTCIDPVTNLTELIQIDGKTVAHIGAKFEQGWLSRYPRPM
eukprot:scaffold5363_cov34-Attheya_sp.AAC.4